MQEYSQSLMPVQGQLKANVFEWFFSHQSEKYMYIEDEVQFVLPCYN